MKRKSKIVVSIFLFLLILMVILQFFNKPLQKKSVIKSIEAPKEVLAILQTSCYNCHSNEQKLNWSDQIFPISWFVNKDIQRAREVMNFSEWNFSKEEQLGQMYAILNMMQNGKMPLQQYAFFHPKAKINQQDIDIVHNYIDLLSKELSNPITDSNQKKESIMLIPDTLPISPNGVRYTSAFKNWKVISMSTLFDNSIRVIYSNNIAVKAIEMENFHPWPDGSIVVKSVWKQSKLANGEIRPGSFVNAQFMVKDSKKYTETEGWGFAKFSGMNLRPTGKDASFAKLSCIACHRQLAEKTGYLFDVPMKVNTRKFIQNLNK